MDAFSVPLDVLNASLGGSSGPLDLNALQDDLGDPLDDLDVPLGDVQLGDDHIHTRHHLRTCLLQLRDRTLGTHRTISAHNHMDHAYGTAARGEGEVQHVPLVASLAHPSLATRTVILNHIHHNIDHHSRCNISHLNHCSLPGQS